jgi:hypothetical protein
MAEIPFAQVGLLAVAVNCTGDATVAPLAGLETVTVAPSAKLESRAAANNAGTTASLFRKLVIAVDAETLESSGPRVNGTFGP